MKRKADAQENDSRKKPKMIFEPENFSGLPNELALEILSYLNEHELRWLRLVNQQLFNIINTCHFNIGVVLDSEMSELTRVFGRYNKPTGLSFKKIEKLGDHASLLTQLTQLTSLDIGLHPFILADKLTNLQSLTALVLLAELSSHTRLTELVTNKLLVERTHVLPTQLQRLRILGLQMFKEVKRYWGGGMTQMELKLDPERYEYFFKTVSNIKHLELCDPTTSSLLPGIECHMTGLESLSTNIAITDLSSDKMTALTVVANYQRGYVNWDIAHLTNLRHLTVTGDEFTKHMNLAPFRLLESLTIHPFTHAYLDRTSFDYLLTQLISPTITQLSIQLVDRAYVACVTNQTNLRQLTLGILFEDDIDIAQLSHLSHLTSLAIKSGPRNLNLQTCTSLKNLMELQVDAYYDNMDEVVVLTSLTRLTHLSIPWRSPTIAYMTNLQILDASHPPVGLSTLHGLTRLHICGSEFDWSSCSALVSLQLLDIDGRINDNQVMTLSGLTRLTSFKAALESGEHLTRLTRLQYLKVLATQGTDAIREDLKKKLIYCQPLEYTFFPPAK